MPITPFDRMVWGLMALLVLAIVLVLLAGDQVGVAVDLLYLDAQGQLAASAPLVLDFDQRMRAATVEERWQIEPEVAGDFSWSGQRLIFTPSGAWQSGQNYRLTLEAGALSQLEHELLEDQSWQFTVRQPGLAYLLEDPEGRRLWAQPDLEAEPIQLSQPEQRVFDYAVAPDGQRLLYSVANDERGLDLWMVDRLGQEALMVLNCGADRCSAPDFSPDGQRVAYARAPAGLSPTEPYGPARVWLLELASGESVRLHADSQKLGYGPLWSPEGSRLAYYDGVEGRIVVVDMATGLETYLPNQSGLVGSWSPDGSQLLFFDVERQEGESINVIYRADLEKRDVLLFFDPQPSEGHYSTPVWSPSGDWVALRVLSSDASQGDQIWVTPEDGRNALVVTDEAGYLHFEFAWDAWGQQLLYRRVQLGVSFPPQEIWAWDRAEGESHLLLPDAVQPAWLP